MDFENDIFVIGEFINTKRKEESLISLISLLKQFNIPILLAGHYPVSPEIQQMCDYYLFDKENPILNKNDFGQYGLLFSSSWTETEDWFIDLHNNSADYCVWTLMRNAANFVESLGKRNIHFIDYDNFPDLDQYKNEFLLPSKNHDAVVLDIPGTPERYVTFIYSIKTYIATNLFNRIKTKDEYYGKHGDKFFLEDIFFRLLNKITPHIYISKYKSIGNDLALYGKDDPDGLVNFILADDYGKIYGYFRVASTITTLVLDIEYNGVRKNHVMPNGYSISNGTVLLGSRNEFITEIGTYQDGATIRIYYNDSLTSTYKLDMGYDVLKKHNKITFKKLK